ncbi:hypothetical protein TNCV_1131191 [Trichonephila clavipes]|nr:hypothetical protein TNCV_1131191 [Trichonephila clavipes]
MMRKWVRQFNDEPPNDNDEARSGWPCVVSDDLIESMNGKIRENRWVTIRLYHNPIVMIKHGLDGLLWLMVIWLKNSVPKFAFLHIHVPAMNTNMCLGRDAVSNLLQRSKVNFEDHV